MSYAGKERSVQSGEPFECYEFVSPVGTFRYTSAPEAKTLGGNVYTPAPVMRGNVEIGIVIDTLQTVDFMLPLKNTLAKAYQGTVLPDYLTVRVYRGHVGETEFQTEWYGEATGYQISQGKFVIKTQSVLQAKILGVAATVYVQYACNNRVYDDRCKLLKASFTQPTEVTLVDNTKITVEDQGYSNNELELGTMLNERTGEERTIKSNVNNLIQVTYPFLDLIVGDSVKLILGCDNRMQTCIDRFDNVANFTGFRYLPLTNPFEDSGDE